MPRHTLNASRHIDEFFSFLIAFIKRFKLRRNFQCVINGDFQLIRNLLCNRINSWIRQTENAADISYCRTSGKCSKCYNLGNMVIAVFPDNIINNFLTSDITKINIKVRHADSFRIEETLKKQIVFHWINAGYTDAVSRKTRRT